MDPLTPQENKEENKSGAGHIDMGSILLPKKEEPGHTVDSAQRVNAGALLEQEINAAALGSDTQQQHAAEKAAEVKPEAEAKPEELVKPLETYQRDIESVVQHDNVSVLSIATAEAERRSHTGEEEPLAKKEKARSLVLNIAMIMGGLIFLVAASGTLAYLLARPTSVPVAATATPNSPFISVDGLKEITITPGESRTAVMSSVYAAQQSISLQLGQMSQLLVTESSTTSDGSVVTPLSAQDFLTLIAPNIPPALARSLEPDYLLGVHVYTGNEAFLIAHVYSYEDAYAGMLAWEPYITKDLSPLFDYSPVALDSESSATTAPTTTDQFIQTGFIDKIVENHDARVLVNANGDIYFLWTFLDRNTLVITTNDATLREIISRLKDAPITPIPGGQ